MAEGGTVQTTPPGTFVDAIMVRFLRRTFCVQFRTFAIPILWVKLARAIAALYGQGWIIQSPPFYLFTATLAACTVAISCCLHLQYAPKACGCQ
jgi:hypothetical protein